MVSNVSSGVVAAIPEPLLRASSTPGKFLLMFFAILVFAGIFGLILFLASLFKGREGEKVQGALFVLPAVFFVAVGLVYPAILTIIQSLKGRSGEGDWSMDNYVQMFTQAELLTVLRNTALWVILVPIFSVPSGSSTRSSSTVPAARPSPRR